MTDAQYAEVKKYERIYTELNDYRIGKARKISIRNLLQGLGPGSYLDVGCGYGTTMQMARDLGHFPVRGVEVVEKLCNDDVVLATAWDLPFDDGSFDYVAMWDVIEHLLPGDDELAIREMCRVARKAVMLSAADYHSERLGQSLHINCRRPDEWKALLEEWANPVSVDISWTGHQPEFVLWLE